MNKQARISRNFHLLMWNILFFYSWLVWLWLITGFLSYTCIIFQR